MGFDSPCLISFRKKYTSFNRMINYFKEDFIMKKYYRMLNPFYRDLFEMVGQSTVVLLVLKYVITLFMMLF